MKDKDFFKSQTTASRLKAEIVSEYFWAWAKIVLNSGEQRQIAYVDLFSGPGLYDDGSKSTPLRILETAIRERQIGQSLRVVLNDNDAEAVARLEAAAAALPGIETLAHKPRITHRDVDQALVVGWLEKWDVPSLVFLDPFGYKGLSKRLIDAGLRHWGTDVILFFNYNRVNAAVTNEFMEDHVAALLTTARVEELRGQVDRALNSEERDEIVLKSVLAAVSDDGKHLTHHFCFQNAKVRKTSHYLIWVSKSHAGLNAIKDIMAKAGGWEDGVPTNEHAPRSIKQIDLFKPRQPDFLREELVRLYAGQTLTVDDLFHLHSPGKDYVRRNYQDALLRLEAEGGITCSPPAIERPEREGKPTMATWTAVTFPAGVGAKS